MAIRTDYADLRIESSETVELSFDVPRVAIIEAVVRDANADELIMLVSMVQRRLGIIQAERIDAVVRNELAEKAVLDKSAETEKQRLRKLLTIATMTDEELGA
jgi:hypothetical protein